MGRFQLKHVSHQEQLVAGGEKQTFAFIGEPSNDGCADLILLFLGEIVRDGRDGNEIWSHMDGVCKGV